MDYMTEQKLRDLIDAVTILVRAVTVKVKDEWNTDARDTSARRPGNPYDASKR